MTEQPAVPTAVVTDGAESASGGDVVWMNHPESEGHARTTREAFESVWAEKGWVLSDDEALRQTEVRGEFVREAGANQGATALAAEQPPVAAPAPATTTTAHRRAAAQGTAPAAPADATPTA